MSNQIQHQAVLENDAVNKLSLMAEMFLHRLLNAVDRYGCFDARIPILRAKLFPLKLDDVTPAQLSEWLTECVNAGLIQLYEVNGQPYLQVSGFKRRLGAVKGAYPPPPIDAPDGTTPTPTYTTTIPVKDTNAMHEHFLKELYKQENAHHLNKLCLRIKRPQLKTAWVQAFNAHLHSTGKKYTVDYEWLDDLRKWLTLNVQQLIKEEAKTISIVFDPAVV